VMNLSWGQLLNEQVAELEEAALASKPKQRAIVRELTALSRSYLRLAQDYQKRADECYQIFAELLNDGRI
jgi:hypothetical protein